jgi:hypothetical protein
MNVFLSLRGENIFFYIKGLSIHHQFFLAPQFRKSFFYIKYQKKRFRYE